MTVENPRRGRGRPPLSAEQRAETRLRVSLTAIELFDEQGFAQTTVDQIAAAAQISPRSYWRLFTSKEDSIRPLVARGIDSVTEQLRDWPPQTTLAEHYERTREQGSVGQLLPPVMLALVRLVHTEPSLHATWLTVHRESETTWGATIAARLGEPPESLRVVLHAAMLNAALRSAIESVVRAEDGIDSFGGRLEPAILSALRELPF